MLLELSKNINHKPRYVCLKVKFWGKIHKNETSGSLNGKNFIFLPHNLCNLSRKGHKMALSVIKHHILQLRNVSSKIQKICLNLGLKTLDFREILAKNSNF